MSKATKWSKNNEGMNYQGKYAQAGLALLRSSGALVLTAAPTVDHAPYAYFDVDEALALARWINDVFGEEKAA